MTDSNEVTSLPAMPPIKIAFIIDGKVVELLNTDERISAILLSDPLIMDVTDRINNPDEYIMLGSTYNSELDKFEYGEGL